MIIIDFTFEHIEQAARLTLQCYDETRGHVPALPEIAAVKSLEQFAKNSLGVAAMENDELAGFLCALPPVKNAFGSTDVTGVFSPMGASGAVLENRAEIYAQMYEYAGKKWAAAGAASHAVCLYAHDRSVNERLFRYGFGLRCVDALRVMEPIKALPCPDYEFCELGLSELPRVFALEYMLHEHLSESPCFINRRMKNELELLNEAQIGRVRYFAALQGSVVAAFISVSEQGGETFICDIPSVTSIGGAFCLPDHRGKGIIQNLLNFLIITLESEGFTRLGVDFESINPAAWAFWLKYFSAYTHSVVRRIDERAVYGR